MEIPLIRDVIQYREWTEPIDKGKVTAGQAVPYFCLEVIVIGGFTRSCENLTWIRKFLFEIMSGGERKPKFPTHDPNFTLAEMIAGNIGKIRSGVLHS